MLAVLQNIWDGWKTSKLGAADLVLSVPEEVKKYKDTDLTQSESE